jgi:putative Holliday junction resolvase
MSDALPTAGRIAGIDFGTVRIGVAVTDPAQQFASPLEIHQCGSLEADSRYFQQLAKEQRLAGFVVGLPVHTSGLESEKSLQAREFARWLAEKTSLPVRLFDERYTSAEAESALLEAGLTKKRRQERLDKIAAQIMLAAYLESSRREASPGAIDDHV